MILDQSWTALDTLTVLALEASPSAKAGRENMVGDAEAANSENRSWRRLKLSASDEVRSSDAVIFSLVFGTEPMLVGETFLGSFMLNAERCRDSRKHVKSTRLCACFRRERGINIVTTNDGPLEEEAGPV